MSDSELDILVAENMFNLHVASEKDSMLRTAIHTQLLKQFPFLKPDATTGYEATETRHILGEKLKRSDCYVVKLINSIEDPYMDSSKSTEAIRQVLDGIDSSSPVTNEHDQPVGGFNSFDQGRSFTDLLASANDAERKLILFNMLIKLLNLTMSKGQNDFDFDMRFKYFTILLNSAELRGNNTDPLHDSYNQQLSRTLNTFIGGVASEYNSEPYSDQSLLIKARKILIATDLPSKDENAKFVANYPVRSKISVMA